MRVLDRAAARVATALIAPGPVRARYVEEFVGELDEVSGLRRLARMGSIAMGAVALHRALVESGAVAFPHSPLWCRARLHHRWVSTRTDDGRTFERCLACGLDQDGTFRAPRSDVTGVLLRGPSQ